MLEPLDHRKIPTLVADDDKADCYDIRVAKLFCAKNDLAEVVKNLLEAFNLWTPYVFHDTNSCKNWYIHFRACASDYASSNTDIDRRTPPLTSSISDPVMALSRYVNMTDFLLRLGC